MTIRRLLLALPALLGIACSTSSSQGKGDTTGAMWPERGEKAAQAAAASAEQHAATSSSQDLLAQGTGSQGGSDTQGSGATGTPPEGSKGEGSSSTGSGADTSGTTPGSGSGGMMGQSGATDSGSPTGSDASRDSGGQETGKDGAGGHMGGPGGHAGHAGHMGGADKAHSDDKTISGKVSKVSDEEISISGMKGQPMTLKIVSETVVMVNGKDAKPEQLKEGQQVRASYNTVESENVAVKIEVGKAKRSSKRGAGGAGTRSGGGAGGSTGGTQGR